MTTKWSSWHLHLGSDAPSLFDRVITDVIGPVVGALNGHPWFFIRYWQAGPHVRLRIGDLDPPSFDVVERSLREALEVAGKLADEEVPLAEAAYQAGASQFAATETGQDRLVQDLLAPGVYRSSYEPEFDRYGGPGLMPRTEQLFQLSSELVLALMPHMPTTHSRTLMALRGTISAAAGLGDEAEQANFYAHSMAAWRAWAADCGCTEEQLGQLCSVTRETGRDGVGPDPNPVDTARHGPFREWHAAIADLAAEIRQSTSTPPAQIVFSHIHMLHNRLGRSLFDELRTYAWLAHVFPRELSPRSAEPPGRPA